MAYLISFLSLIAALVYGIYSITEYFSTRKNANAIVTGVITGAHCDSVLASAIADTTPESWWYIEYVVNGKKYKIRLTAYGSNKKVKEKIGSSVTVHYDKRNPSKAWAEKPQ